MKVKIKDLEPNPFRDIENYPIDEMKVENLVNSINETGFWENILARKRDGKIQIAYGHHRLQALQQIYALGDEIDIPVKELDDATMLKIMANENYDAWGTNTKVLDETVRVARNFLKEHPEEAIKYYDNKYKNIGASQNASIIGATIIARFLGGNWTRDMIDPSIERLKLQESGELDKEAVELFDKPTYAKRFTDTMKKEKITDKPTQQKLAKKIIDNDDFSEAGMKITVAEERLGEKESKQKKELILFEDIISKCTKQISDLIINLEEITKFKKTFNSSQYDSSIQKYNFMVHIEKLIKVSMELLKKEK